MFPALRAASLAACLCCAPAVALHVDKLHNNDILNTGSLTISLQGACQTRVKLEGISLHTYNPLDSQSEGMWLSGETATGKPVANYYNLVLVDSRLNLIAAYAPARTSHSEVVDSGISVQQLNEYGAGEDFRSSFTLHAAQDAAGALDAVLDYLSVHQPQALACDAIDADTTLSNLDEARSFVSVDDLTIESAKQTRAKTQLRARSVTALVREQLQNHSDGSYQLSRELQPLTIELEFQASQGRAF